MHQTSYIELSRKAYRSNIRFIKKIVGKDVKISIVVKGNAYGHGVEEIVKMAEENNMHHFAVFSAYEAEQVFRVMSEKSQIMIMGYMSDHQLEWAVENEFEFYVFDRYRLEMALDYAKSCQKKARIHLELETGFKRTGIEPEDLLSIARLLKKNNEHFILEGICTHLAGAESISNFVRIKEQLSCFRKYCTYFKRHGLVPLRRHTASSAATLLYPQARFDMVRVGIAQYGFWPTIETLIHRYNKWGDKESSLKRVISWKSKIMEVKMVKRGEFIGYGTNYMANKDMKIAIIPVGYNNGFSRSLSNKGRVLIAGKRLQVVGIVTMNTTSVNVTDINDVKPGDEVVLIGRQKNMIISVASFCEMSENLNYQVLARLPNDIPRYVID